MTNITPKMPEVQPPYWQATGKMPYSLTNDYLFRALLQRNNRVLKHLICALLHLQPHEVNTVTIENPIVLGEALDTKTFILDVRVMLNDHALINLEMQIVNYLNWPERSLSYLCRNFDQLQRGQDYLEARPVIHIGFLDFTLFPECPEFYATYKLLNVKNHHIFTDKFVLSVVDLNQIELATEEDRRWKIDYWAALFTATTWEEVKMLAEQNPIIEDAVVTMYEMSAEDAIREQCWAREDYYRTLNTLKAHISNRDKLLEQHLQLLEQKDKEVEQKEQMIEQKQQVIEQKDQEIEQKEQVIEQKEQVIEQKEQVIEQKEQTIQQKNLEIERLLQEVERLKKQTNQNATQ